jgi:hypothetical protein
MSLAVVSYGKKRHLHTGGILGEYAVVSLESHLVCEVITMTQTVTVICEDGVLKPEDKA